MHRRRVDGVFWSRGAARLAGLLAGAAMLAAVSGAGCKREGPTTGVPTPTPGPPVPDPTPLTEPPAAEARTVEHAVASFRPLAQIGHAGLLSGAQAGGVLRIELTEGGARLTGTLTGLAPGPHGLHVHERGDCSSAEASGGHFNPGNDPHGAPADPPTKRHAGDFGNVVADQQGRAQVDMAIDRSLLAEGERNILGRAMIVHAGKDDLTSQPAGNAGDRLACAVIRAGTSEAADKDKAPRVP